ncbi:MAG: bifunctional nuclease family protein [Candidatus Latescibacteria bacterium]|nr:bifunctional nuclease family protein [Candidatus Latescibacterota bacterium]
MYDRCRSAAIYFCALWLCLSGILAPAVYPSEKDLVKTQVHQVGRDSEDQYVVFLRNSETARLLPIWIGPCEAMAIWRKLKNETFPRPFTHDLFHNVLEEAGVRLKSIVIDELRPLEEGGMGSTYFAVLTLQGPDGTTFKMDARPSDSMALAVRMGLPVHVVRGIIESHGIPENEAPPKPAAPRKTPRYF